MDVLTDHVASEVMDLLKLINKPTTKMAKRAICWVIAGRRVVFVGDTNECVGHS